MSSRAHTVSFSPVVGSLSISSLCAKYMVSHSSNRLYDSIINIRSISTKMIQSTVLNTLCTSLRSLFDKTRSRDFISTIISYIYIYIFIYKYIISFIISLSFYLHSCKLFHRPFSRTRRTRNEVVREREAARTRTRG